MDGCDSGPFFYIWTAVIDLRTIGWIIIRKGTKNISETNNKVLSICTRQMEIG
jgi:hypothetical protein